MASTAAAAAAAASETASLGEHEVREVAQAEIQSLLPDELDRIMTPIVEEMRRSLTQRLDLLQREMAESQRQLATFLAEHTEAGVRALIDAILLATVDSRFAIYDNMLATKLNEITKAANATFDELESGLLSLQSRLPQEPAQ